MAKRIYEGMVGRRSSPSLCGASLSEKGRRHNTLPTPALAKQLPTPALAKQLPTPAHPLRTSSLAPRLGGCFTRLASPWRGGWFAREAMPAPPSLPTPAYASLRLPSR
ncbi:hypothetical protein PHLCEN_2v11063 [Hermanssonia centrifuga]|uniref:Uncharacterized protein n=1 Tax=Hermanssonia centrifuga TaxID=98765 RepID=A0A2R6NL01_9APHY|nr:hypothetical protein PHLCEN_2v11063 [Hermanssonia centrifuga]